MSNDDLYRLLGDPRNNQRGGGGMNFVPNTNNRGNAQWQAQQNQQRAHHAHGGGVGHMNSMQQMRMAQAGMAPIPYGHHPKHKKGKETRQRHGDGDNVGDFVDTQQHFAGGEDDVDQPVLPVGLIPPVEENLDRRGRGQEINSRRERRYHSEPLPERPREKGPEGRLKPQKKHNYDSKLEVFNPSKLYNKDKDKEDPQKYKPVYLYNKKDEPQEGPSCSYEAAGFQFNNAKDNKYIPRELLEDYKNLREKGDTGALAIHKLLMKKEGEAQDLINQENQESFQKRLAEQKKGDDKYRHKNIKKFMRKLGVPMEESTYEQDVEKNHGRENQLKDMLGFIKESKEKPVNFARNDFYHDRNMQNQSQKNSQLQKGARKNLKSSSRHVITFSDPNFYSQEQIAQNKSNNPKDERVASVTHHDSNKGKPIRAVLVKNGTLFERKDYLKRHTKKNHKPSVLTNILEGKRRMYRLKTPEKKKQPEEQKLEQ